MTNDDLALRTILQRLEAGQWPVNGMLRYEQALAALNPGDQYSAGVTLLERINPWNQNSRLVMVIYTASDMDQNNKYLLVKFKDDVPGLRYRLWGYEDRIHQSGKSDMKDWQLKAGSSVAMVFEVIGGFTGIADLIEVKVGSTWAESDRVDVVSGKVSGEALDQAILLRSFMGSLKAKENPYSLDQKQVESYLGGIPDGPNKVMLERFWYLLTKEKR